MTEKSINKILQDRSIPAYIKSDYPVFVSFLNAYFEWLEQEKKPHDIAINLQKYRGIDTTLVEFVDYFTKEVMVNIPKDVGADKRLLAKHIKNFYLNKGNEASYRFLFRILFNENIEFYYPKTDVLRASDGKWYEQKSIKITLSDPDNLFAYQLSNSIVGLTSGARAIVESALNFLDRGVNIVELSLSEIKGTFQHGEEIQITYIDADGGQQIITETILEIFTDVEITAGGSAYAIDDLFIIRDESAAEIAKGVVKQVTKGPITGLTIEQAGTGYKGNIKEVTKFYALPINWTLNGDYLLTTVLDGSDSNSSGTDYTAYDCDETVPLQEIPGTGDQIVVTDSDTSSGSGAFGVVEVVGNDGEITEISLIEGGYGYQDPTADVDSTKGVGAEIGIVGGGGAVSKVGLLNFPVVTDNDLDSNGFTVYPDFTGAGDGNATGEMESNTLAEYPGRYLNEDGHLSSSKRLQDNFFYQDYSYVIKVGLAIANWRDIVKKIIHPAGLIVFGEVEFVEVLDAAVSFSENKLIRTISTSVGSQTAIMDEAIIKLYVYDSNNTAQPVLDSNENHLIDWDKDSSGEYVQT